MVRSFGHSYSRLTRSKLALLLTSRQNSRYNIPGIGSRLRQTRHVSNNGALTAIGLLTLVTGALNWFLGHKRLEQGSYALVWVVLEAVTKD